MKGQITNRATLNLVASMLYKNIYPTVFILLRKTLVCKGFEFSTRNFIFCFLINGIYFKPVPCQYNM